MNAPQGMRRPVYFRWWFWVALVFLLAGTWYLKSYFDWRGDYDLAHTDEYARGLAAQLFKYQADQLQEQYKNDTYGGDTPEETLRLFVEALEQKDFALAAKYYVPESQRQALKDFEDAKDLGGLERFTVAYRTGTQKTGKSEATGDYGIEIFPRADTTGFYIQFTKNNFTNRWKISEF